MVSRKIWRCKKCGAAVRLYEIKRDKDNRPFHEPSGSFGVAPRRELCGPLRIPA